MTSAAADTKDDRSKARPRNGPEDTMRMTASAAQSSGARSTALAATWPTVILAP